MGSSAMVEGKSTHPLPLPGSWWSHTYIQYIHTYIFVDDLKLLARSLTKAKLLQDIITTFSKDIGMTFGQAKCTYIYIEHGKRKSLGRNIEINELSATELKEGDRVKKEYERHVRKIWNSELYSHNKITAHNTFAIPVLAPMIGILNWTKQEIQHLDVDLHKRIAVRPLEPMYSENKEEEV